MTKGLPEPAESSVAAMTISIALNNLVRGIGVTGLASLFSVGRFPLGYLVPWLSFALYGFLLGTNSFALPNPDGTIAPTIAVAWTRSGLRELSAYVLVAAALSNMHLWRQLSWLNTRTERVRSWADIRLTWSEILGLIAALVLVGWSACIEARQIINQG